MHDDEFSYETMDEIIEIVNENEPNAVLILNVGSAPNVNAFI